MWIPVDVLSFFDSDCNTSSGEKETENSSFSQTVHHESGEGNVKVLITNETEDSMPNRESYKNSELERRDCDLRESVRQF